MGTEKAPKTADEGASKILFCIYEIGFGNNPTYNGKFLMDNQVVDFI